MQNESPTENTSEPTNVTNPNHEEEEEEEQPKPQNVITDAEHDAAKKIYGLGTSGEKASDPLELDRTRVPDRPGFRADEEYVDRDEAVKHVPQSNPQSTLSGVPTQGTRHSNEQGQIDDLRKKMEQIRAGKQIPLIALEDDVYRQRDQNFAAISFIPKELYTNLQQDRTSAGKAQDLIKIRGIFKTREAAEKHIKRLMNIDPHFDVHLVECHRWTTIGSASLDENVYLEDTISEIMKGYFDREHDMSSSLEERVEQARQDGKAGHELGRPNKEFFDQVQKEVAEHGIPGDKDESAIPDVPEGADINELNMKQTAEVVAASVLDNE